MKLLGDKRKHYSGQPGCLMRYGPLARAGQAVRTTAIALETRVTGFGADP